MTKKPAVSPLKPLTRKQKLFVQHIIDNPKSSGKAAAIAAYNTTTEKSAEVIASENLRKPEIMAFLDEHARLAKETVLDVIETSRRHMNSGTKDGAAYAAVALNGGKDILDRVYGKAKQSLEVNSTSITLSIDLSGRVLSPSEATEKLETDK